MRCDKRRGQTRLHRHRTVTTTGGAVAGRPRAGSVAGGAMSSSPNCETPPAAAARARLWARLSLLRSRRWTQKESPCFSLVPSSRPRRLVRGFSVQGCARKESVLSRHSLLRIQTRRRRQAVTTTEGRSSCRRELGRARRASSPIASCISLSAAWSDEEHPRRQFYSNKAADEMRERVDRLIAATAERGRPAGRARG